MRATAFTDGSGTSTHPLCRHLTPVTCRPGPCPPTSDAIGILKREMGMDSLMGQVAQAGLSARRRHPTGRGPGICTDRTPSSFSPSDNEARAISRASLFACRRSVADGQRTLWHPARRSTWHENPYLHGTGSAAVLDLALNWASGTSQDNVCSTSSNSIFITLHMASFGSIAKLTHVYNRYACV